MISPRIDRRGEERLHANDMLDFHRAFGRRRLDASSELRGWGVVFEDADDRASFRPERRLESAPLSVLTAPAAAPAKRY